MTERAVATRRSTGTERGQPPVALPRTALPDVNTTMNLWPKAVPHWASVWTRALRSPRLDSARDRSDALRSKKSERWLPSAPAPPKTRPGWFAGAARPLCRSTAGGPCRSRARIPGGRVFPIDEERSGGSVPSCRLLRPRTWCGRQVRPSKNPSVGETVRSGFTSRDWGSR